MTNLLSRSKATSQEFGRKAVTDFRPHTVFGEKKNNKINNYTWA